MINNNGNNNKTSPSVDFWIKFKDLASTLFDSGRFVDLLFFFFFLLENVNVKTGLDVIQLRKYDSVD